LPRRALAEKRPWLLASLLFGIGYIFVRDSQMPGLYQIAWKGAAVGLLALYAALRHHSRDAKVLAVVLALGAAGDMAIEIDQRAGAVLFLVGHLVAAALYAAHRRAQVTPSQQALAVVLLIAVPLLGWLLPADRSAALPVAIYGLALGAMAAAAWTSNFPRYRVGTGALLFVFSDLLIFARLGPLSASDTAHWLIWPTYYFGQFLICVGVLSTLRERDL